MEDIFGAYEFALKHQWNAFLVFDRDSCSLIYSSENVPHLLPALEGETATTLADLKSTWPESENPAFWQAIANPDPASLPQTLYPGDRTGVDAGIPVLLYEAGEALRFDEIYVRAGVKGILNVMRSIGMLRKSRRARAPALPVICDQTVWVRAPESGVLRTLVALGAKVTSGQVIALVADPLGSSETAVIAPHHGVVIGRTNLPLVYEGDATFHIARYGRKVSTVEKQVERFHEEHQAASASDPPEDISRAPIA